MRIEERGARGSWAESHPSSVHTCSSLPVPSFFIHSFPSPAVLSPTAMMVAGTACVPLL